MSKESLPGKKKGKGEVDGESESGQGGKPSPGRDDGGEEVEEEQHGVENGGEGEVGEGAERKKNNKRPRKRKPKTEKGGGDNEGAALEEHEHHVERSQNGSDGKLRGEERVRGGGENHQERGTGGLRGFQGGRQNKGTKREFMSIKDIPLYRGRCVYICLNVDEEKDMN